MLTDKEQEEIRRKMLELEEAPPLDGWSRISTQIQPPKQALPYWWLLAVLVLLLGGLVYYQTGIKPREAASLASVTSAVEKGTPSATGVPGSADTAKKQASAGVTDQTDANTAKPGVPAVEKQVVPQPSGGEGQPVIKPVSGSKLVDAKQPAPVLRREKHNGSGTAATTAGQSATIAEVSLEKLSFLETKLPSNSNPGGFDSVYVAPDSEEQPAQVAGVTETGKAKGTREWYVGVTVATRFIYSKFTPATSDEIYITNMTARSKFDPERLGYEYGFTLGKAVRSNLYLETSVLLMQLRENVSYQFTNGSIDTLIKSFSTDGTMHIKPVYVTGERQLKSTFSYGGLRVGATYFFGETEQGRYNLTVAGGMNLLVKGRTEEYRNGEFTRTVVFPSEDDPLEQMNYNLMIGAGYSKAISNSYEVMLMPNLNYFLGSTFAKREPFGLKPYTLGLSLQLRRRFRKEPH